MLVFVFNKSQVPKREFWRPARGIEPVNIGYCITKLDIVFLLWYSFYMSINIKSLENEILELKNLIKKQNESTFSCVGCANQHQQILDWLSELRDYESGKIGKNKENPNIVGYMTLDEAISHTSDVINNNTDQEIIDKHKELYIWLTTLKNYRKKA